MYKIYKYIYIYLEMFGNNDLRNKWKSIMKN